MDANDTGEEIATGEVQMEVIHELERGRIVRTVFTAAVLSQFQLTTKAR